jgi:hypothetical protein
MTPLGTITAGFQIILSWLMSMLAVLAVFVSVIICIAFVEFIFGHAAILQAYTVKTYLSEDGASSRIKNNKM